MSVDSNPPIPLLSLPVGRVTSRGTNRANVSTQDYANAVDSHAKQPYHRALYPGPIYQDLAIYLQRKPLPPRVWSNGTAHVQARRHATVHALDAKTGKAPTAWSDADACCKELNANTSQQVPQLVFLRGLSCPQWLNKIAVNLHVDPEFLNSNMQFRCRETYAAYPAPPSTYDHIIRIRIVTIGRRDDIPWGRPNPQMVEKLRSEAKTKMESYRHDLVSNDNMRCGDSIVRDYHVLGERHFFLEQEISVYMHSGESAWTALICSDFGNSLTEGPRGPWLSDSDLQPGRVNTTTFFPTIQHRKKVAFKSKLIEQEDLEGANPNYAQTASLLALDYGRLLDKPAMASDAFYALHDLFRFAIASDNQLLNLIEDYVRLDTGHESLANDRPSLSNLVYYRELLESYSGHLNENIQVLRRRDELQWPRVSEPGRSSHGKVEIAAEALLRDAEYLQRRADSICKRCERGMSVIMNNRMLAESKRAISQANTVARLTFIAFVYIPLSFTTSLFGMNLNELGSGPLPIWIWIATSVPVLCTTVILFFLDFQRIRDMWQSVRSWSGPFRRTRSTDDKVV